MKAFVEIQYDDDGAAFAGASCGTLKRAEVVEVEAVDEREACSLAKKKYDSDKYVTVRGTRFLRWV